MLSADSEPVTGSAGAQPKASPPRRRALRIFLLVVGLALVLLVAGFFWFVRLVAVVEHAPERNTDGIVVLTGAALRINDALDLLAARRGRRLLITGVNPATRSGEISRLMPEHQRWFSCCVDLDHSATNTVGNAIETRRWIKARGFKSLIVVTSNFHMPRAMAELAHQLPDVALVPFPVVSEKVRVESWWSNPATARLLFWEYLKYIVAHVRMQIQPVPA
jgi:uncharacterized SAM-binding protein YcdF (DUF218 family)